MLRFAQHDSAIYVVSSLKSRGILILLLGWLALLAGAQAQTDSFEKLADDFWTWRAKHAPFTADDVNRLERPGGIRDWSRASIDHRSKDLVAFEALEEIESRTMADPEAGRLQIDWLGIVPCSLGTRS